MSTRDNGPHLSSLRRGATTLLLIDFTVYYATLWFVSVTGSANKFVVLYGVSCLVGVLGATWLARLGASHGSRPGDVVVILVVQVVARLVLALDIAAGGACSRLLGLPLLVVNGVALGVTSRVGVTVIERGAEIEGARGSETALANSKSVQYCVHFASFLALIAAGLVASLSRGAFLGVVFVLFLASTVVSLGLIRSIRVVRGNTIDPRLPGFEGETGHPSRSVQHDSPLVALFSLVTAAVSIAVFNVGIGAALVFGAGTFVAGAVDGAAILAAIGAAYFCGREGKAWASLPKGAAVLLLPIGAALGLSDSLGASAEVALWTLMAVALGYSTSWIRTSAWASLLHAAGISGRSASFYAYIKLAILSITPLVVAFVWLALPFRDSWKTTLMFAGSGTLLSVGALLTRGGEGGQTENRGSRGTSPARDVIRS